MFLAGGLWGCLEAFLFFFSWMELDKEKDGVELKLK
jgi:hypothetical protein